MKYSTLKIDEEEYRLGYDFNEICDAEALTGCNLLAAVMNVGAAGAAQLRGLLWAAIRACPYDSMPSSGALLKKCGSLIRLDTIAPIIMALGHACALGVSEEYGEKFVAAMRDDPKPAADTPEEPSKDGE